MTRQTRLRFAHPLTAEAAHGSLLLANRRVLHSLAAEALAERHVAGAPGETALLAQRLGHLEACQRWPDAHACACQLLETTAGMGDFTRWAEYEARARAAAEHAAPAPGQAPALLLNALASRAYTLGQLLEMRRLGELALAAAREQQLPQAEAKAHLRLALGCLNSAELDAGEQHLLQAMELAAQHNLDRIEADAATSLGLLLYRRGDHGAALEQLLRARELHRRLGNLRGQAVTLLNTAIALRALGRRTDGAAAVREALALAQAVGDRATEGVLLGNMANELIDDAQYAAAIPHVREAIRLLAEVGDALSVSHYRVNLANTFRVLGRWEKAEDEYAAAHGEQQRQGDVSAQALTLANWALLRMDRGEFASAHAALAEARSLYQRIGDRLYEGWTVRLAADVAWAAGELDRAGALLHEAEAVVAPTQYASELGLIELRRRRLYLALGHDKEAQAALLRARQYNGQPGGDADPEFSRELAQMLAAAAPERPA